MFNIQKTILMILSVGLIIIAIPAMSAIPNQINYQGRLTDNTGSPVPDGPYTITFSIYNDLKVMEWREIQNDVLVINGIFNVLLPGSPGIEPFPGDLFDESLYIGIQVGTDDEMVPLQPLTSVPFAFKAGDADTLQGLPSNAFLIAELDPTVEPSVKDGVSWTELSDIPPDIADGDAIGITIEDDPTVHASVKDGVSWGELSGIPAGFADDFDNDSGGDITGVTAGTGLSGGAYSGHASLRIQKPLWLSEAITTDAIINGYNTGSGVGVSGRGGSYGIRGQNNTSLNVGLLGTSTDGVSGYSNTVNGSGVAGINSSSGNGIYGSSLNGFAGRFDGSVVVFGKSGSSWDNFLGLAHNGTDGIISTNTGDIVLDPAGNIGIGLSNPSTMMHVKVESSEVEYALKLENTNELINSGVGIIFAPGGDGPDRGKGALAYKYTNTWNRGDFHFFQRSDANADIVDINDSVMVIANNGNVGIGALSSVAKLNVAGNLTVAGVRNDSSVIGRFRNNSLTTATSIQIDGHGSQDKILYFSDNGNLEWSLRSRGQDDRFELRDHNSGLDQVVLEVERLINPLSYNMIMHGDILPSLDDQYRLGVLHQRWQKIYSVDGVSTSSDGRLKKNIDKLDYGLDEIMNLRPVSFQWKNDKEKDQKLGLIAQEVNSQIPEVVDIPESEEGAWGINYSSLVPILIKAIQEQQGTIETLQARLDELEENSSNIL